MFRVVNEDINESLEIITGSNHQQLISNFQKI